MKKLLSLIAGLMLCSSVAQAQMSTGPLGGFGVGANGGSSATNIYPGSGFTAGAIIPSLIPSAAGKIWWVDGGSHCGAAHTSACVDTNDCLTPGTACLTIQAGLNKTTSGAGDVVMVAQKLSGTYLENLTNTKSSISLIAYNGDTSGPLTQTALVDAVTGVALTNSGNYDYFHGIIFESDAVAVNTINESGTNNTYDSITCVGNGNNDKSCFLLNNALSTTIKNGLVESGKNGIELSGSTSPNTAILGVSFVQNNSADIVATAAATVGFPIVSHNYFLDVDKASYIDMSAAASGTTQADGNWFNVTTLNGLKRSQLGSMTNLVMQGNWPDGAVGSLYVKDFSITTTAILSASATTFGTASGNMQVDQIIAESGATAIAGCTNINLISNNAIGVTGTIAAVAAASLSANKNVNMTDSSIATPLKPFVMEDTKILQHQATVGACTGGSTIHFTISGKRISPYASIN